MSSSTFLDESDEYKCIYDYLTYGEYPTVATKSMKGEIRRRATKYVVNGQMLFVTNGNETKRLLIKLNRWMCEFDKRDKTFVCALYLN